MTTQEIKAHDEYEATIEMINNLPRGANRYIEGKILMAWRLEAQAVLRAQLGLN